MPTRTRSKSSTPKRTSTTASKTSKTTKTSSTSRKAKKSKATTTGSTTRRKSRASKGSAAAGGVKAAGGITNYTTAMRWLYEHVDYERLRVVPYNKRTFSLDRMRKLLGALGDPHAALQCVQVAGTKGKGSSCAMLASMLQSCGYTIGLYSSPHLVDLRERMTIDGQMPSHAETADLFKRVAVAEQELGEPGLSFFEIMTAVALRYFADQAVDLAVLETGLGGRLDCTTVVTPLVTGITRIGYDHMNILGKDLESIAKEKAGIFKKGVPALSVPQEPAVAQVLTQVAEEVGAPIEFIGQEVEFSYRFEANRELGPHSRVSIISETNRFEHLAVPLRGEHQAHNCGLSLAMVDKLICTGMVLPEEKVIAGLAQTKLAGRMEQVWPEPRVIVDGAHNGASLQALIRALGAHIAYDSLVMIFGCGQDKDVAGMLKQIALGADKIIFTRAKANPRASEPEDLHAKFAEISGKMAQTADTLDDALKLAGRAVSREDLIIITGSFYLAGEGKKLFADRQAKQRR